MYITSTKVNLVVHPSSVVNQVPVCLAGVKAGNIHLCQIAAKTVIHMAGDDL